MGRMHSGKHGKSGSKKPYKNSKKTWIRYSPSELEALVVKLSKGGKTPSQIGLMLRDSYGVLDVKSMGMKKITKILAENSLLPKLPEDIVALIKREINLMRHVEVNKHDYSAKLGLTITESKINRLAKYYKRTGQIPADWKYNREDAKLMIG